jgi:hypothetical protein
MLDESVVGVMAFTVVAGSVVAIDSLNDVDRLARLALSDLGA